MNITLRKSNVDNKLINVITMDEYMSNPSYYGTIDTGIKVVKDGKTYVLPFRNGQYNPYRPGIYKCPPLLKFVYPSKSEESKYTNPIIDFGNSSSITDLIKKEGILKNVEKDILSYSGCSFNPPISDNDTPIMRGLKEAVSAKNIDLDSYADRFGDNYPNDKRQFKRNSITLFMFERMCKCLDMKAKLIITDSADGIANPIGRDIVVDLVSDDSESDMENGGD